MNNGTGFLIGAGLFFGLAACGFFLAVGLESAAKHLANGLRDYARVRGGDYSGGHHV